LWLSRAETVVAVSHPFAKNANGWGTQRLWLSRAETVVAVSHPFAKNANGWGTEFWVDELGAG